MEMEMDMDRVDTWVASILGTEVAIVTYNVGRDTSLYFIANLIGTQVVIIALRVLGIGEGEEEEEDERENNKGSNTNDYGIEKELRAERDIYIYTSELTVFLGPNSQAPVTGLQVLAVQTSLSSHTLGV